MREAGRECDSFIHSLILTFKNYHHLSMHKLFLSIILPLNILFKILKVNINSIDFNLPWVNLELESTNFWEWHVKKLKGFVFLSGKWASI